MIVSHKTVLVTGGTSGIGLELVNQLTELGAIVHVLGRKKRIAIEKTFFHRCDLSDSRDTLDFCKNISDKGIKFDLVIHNAGVGQKSFALKTEDKIEERIFEINYNSVVKITKLFLKNNVINNKGKFVIISSLVGKFGAPHLSAYSASKFALVGYFESLRYEVDPNHSILIVYPGFINTSIDKKSLDGAGNPINIASKAQEKGLSVEKCAKKILKAIRKNKKQVNIGKMELLFPKIKFFAPNFFYFLIKKLHKL